MKHPVIRYEFSQGGPNHFNRVFPNYGSDINILSSYFVKNWLPGQIAGNKKPAVNLIPVGFFLRNRNHKQLPDK